MNKIGEEYARELEEAERSFSERFSRWQSEHVEESPLKRFPLRALAWLALAPEWPLKVAEQGFPDAGGLTTGPAVVEELAALYDARVCQSADSDDGRGRVFWMNPAQQSSVLELLKTLPDEEIKSFGVRHFLRRQLSEASSAMERATATGRTLNTPLRRWIELARSAESDEGLARLLREKVEQAIAEAEQRRQVVSPEALRWIKAAKPFVGWFGEPVEWAVVQSSRRLELFYRRAYDERSLKNYYARREQEQAFEELLEGSGEARQPDAAGLPWALHYVGLGGTGKTMLMRHISTHLAREKNLAVARVDFDRLNPDYPSRTPGLLLMSFAEELRPFAAEVGSDVFARFDKEVDSLHDRISASFRSGAPRTVGVGDSEFQLVLDLFTSAVNRLFEKKSGVVLILDTCEELARLRSDNTLPDSVHVTFDILERIHRRVERLRVVFSGRRPLARAGHALPGDGEKRYAWTCPASKLPERDYLRLNEIRGFRRGEAYEFLESYKGEAEEDGAETRVNPGLFEAIIKQSCSADEHFDSRFERHDGRGEAASGPEPRFNPFELDMFARWATCEPDLTEREINAGANHYVRERIIKRADHRVRAVLPGVTLLGRFDEALIRRFIEEQGRNPDVVFPELIESEILDVDRNASESGTVWVMDAIMRKRLRKFYDEEAPAELVAATQTLARIMYDLTLERGWEDLSTAYFATTLEVLMHDEPRAARWWAEVEARLAREAQWNWAKTITDELLSEGGLAAKSDAALGASAAAESRLRPAILATQAAARTHLLFTDPQADRAGLHAVWSEVAEKADRHPTPDGAARLARRAVAGMAAALRWRSEVPAAQRLGEMLELCRRLPADGPGVDESGAASELAMLEAVVEVAEEAEERGERGEFEQNLYQFGERYWNAETPDWWPQTLPHDLRIFSRTLSARLLKLCGRHEEATHLFEGILNPFREFGPTGSGPVLQRWPDWHQPDNIFARVALEFARHAISGYLSVGWTPNRLVLQVALTLGSDVLSSLPPSFRGATLDNERLASALLLLRSYEAASGAAGQWDEESIASSVALQGAGALCNAHRVVPPFFATALDVGCSAGRVGSAVGKLYELARSGNYGSSYVGEEAEYALLSVAARLRLPDETGFLDYRPGADGAPQRRGDHRDPFAIIEALSAARPEPPRESGRAGAKDVQSMATELHVGWRRRGPEYGVDLEKFPHQLEYLRRGDFDGLSLELDGLEARLIAKRVQTYNFAELGAVCGEWIKSNPTRPVEAFTLGLRVAALTGIKFSLNDLRNTEQKEVDGDPGVYRRTVDLLPLVGRRRAAEIAFEEGTLLALRLPEQACAMLSWAYEWFAEANDPLQQLLTATLLSMTHVRTGDGDAQRLWLKKAAVEAYPAMRKLDSSLPEWDELATAVETSGGTSLSEFAQNLNRIRYWRPWLVRLLGCMVIARPSGSRLDNLLALRRFVTENYGSVVNGQRVVSPEFEFLFAPVKQSFGEGVRTAYFTLVAGLAKLKNVGYFLVGAGMGVGFMYLSGLLTQYVVSFIRPITLWQGVVIFVCLLACGFALPRVLRLYMSVLVSMMVGIYKVTSDAVVADVNCPPLSALRLTEAAPLNLFRPQSVMLKSPAGGSEELTSSIPYRALGRALNDTHRRWLEFRRRWAGTRRVMFRLIVDETSAAAPLEAIFQLSSEKIEKFQETRLVCVRGVPARSSWPAGAPVRRLRVVTLASAVAHVDIAGAGWGKGPTDVPLVHTVEDPRSLMKGKTIKAGVDIVHFIGKPVDAGGKLALELSGVEPHSYASRGVPTEPGSPGRGVRVHPSDIPLRLPDVKLCVIQLPPTSDATRDASSRYEAGLLRRFGAKLSSRGVPGVLLLPALSEDVATLAIGTLAEWAAREAARGPRRWWHIRLTKLPLTVRKMQEAIAAGYEKDPEAALELPLDVCLYTAGYVELGVRREAPPVAEKSESGAATTTSSVD